MKSNALFTLIFCLAVGGAGALGQSVEALGVGKPSAFQYIEGDRDPFWPIGWTKKVVELSGTGTATTVAVEVAPKAESFYVSSISLDLIPLAVINGKAYGIGDRFLLSIPVEKAEPKTFRMQVTAIRDGVVVLRYGMVELNCPLRVVGTPTSGTPAPGAKPASK
ncbi:MAG: hypothetical protein ACFUZC_13435 [Chthoniobacteraceae bacterium]